VASSIPGPLAILSNVLAIVDLPFRTNSGNYLRELITPGWSALESLLWRPREKPTSEPFEGGVEIEDAAYIPDFRVFPDPTPEVPP